MSGKEPDDRRRTIGSAIGSGVSNIITGYAAAPHLFADKGREFSAAALKKNPVGHLKRIYGGSALKKGLILAGVATVGGAIKEKVQAVYEKRKQASQELTCSKCGAAGSTGWKTGWCGDCEDAQFRSKSAGFMDGFRAEMERQRSDPRRFMGDLDGIRRFDLGDAQARWKTAGVSMMLYRRHPGELGKEPPRKAVKGPAKIFGSRFNIHEVRRGMHRKKEDDWMRQHAEALDLGDRPGLAANLQESFGMREGSVVPRAGLKKMMREKDTARSESVTRRRFAKAKGRPELGADSRHDAGAFIKDLGALLENPDLRYAELARK